MAGRAPATGEPRISPNGAYRATRVEGPGGALVLEIDRERPAPLRLTVREIDARYGPRIEWVNEKLLFVRVWWGRILGADLVIDVEVGAILYREMLHDGTIPFQQFRQAREP